MSDWPSQLDSIACVIPTHSRDELLSEAIESVLGQTVRPERIVVVDDVASAETESLLKRLDETASIPLHYLTNLDPSTPGASGSRNAGAAFVESEYIAFLDDDDLWEPRYLEESMAQLRGNPEISMVVTWTKMTRGKFEGPGLSIEPNASASDVLHRNPGLTGSNFVIRRSAFVRLQFDPGLPVANDRDFLIRFLDGGGRYGIAEEPLVVQRAHDFGQLTSRTERRARGLEAFLAKYSDRMTRADRLELERIIHSIRRVSSETRLGRLKHSLLQVVKDSPKRMAIAALERLSGRPTIYK
jgi:glycosyltransferase involved in cell wall biosynthesis